MLHLKNSRFPHVRIPADSPVPIWSPLSFPPAPSAASLHSCDWSPSWTDSVLAEVEGSRGAGEVEVEEAPGVLWDQRGSGVGNGAESGYWTVCAGPEGGDVRAETVDEPFGWRTGSGAVIGGVEAEAERWRGWAGVAGGAERSREVAGACGAAGEDV